MTSISQSSASNTQRSASLEKSRVEEPRPKATPTPAPGHSNVDSFEECVARPAVANELLGAVVGAELVEVKGVSGGGKTTGTRIDGTDCSPPPVGEVGVLT